MKKIVIKSDDLWEGIRKFVSIVKEELVNNEELVKKESKEAFLEMIEKLLARMDIIDEAREDIDRTYSVSTHDENYQRYSINDRHKMVDVLVEVFDKFEHGIGDDIIEIGRENTGTIEKIGKMGIILDQYASFIKKMRDCIVDIYASKTALVELGEENGIDL